MKVERNGWTVIRRIGVGDREHVRSGLLQVGCICDDQLETQIAGALNAAIRDKKTNAIYGGDAALQALGLPSYGTCRLAPGSHPAFDIFVQSTSVNRKLPAGTHVLYWPKVGVGYKEGPSAR